jgi:hypothetical protein
MRTLGSDLRAVDNGARDGHGHDDRHQHVRHRRQGRAGRSKLLHVWVVLILTQDAAGWQLVSCWLALDPWSPSRGRDDVAFYNTSVLTSHSIVCRFLAIQFLGHGNMIRLMLMLSTTAKQRNYAKGQ